MRAMLLTATGSLDANPAPLELADIDDPSPGDDEILIRVAACGVCHTELDEIEGRTPPPSLPVVPGHEVVGRVVSCGNAANRFRRGDRVGVGWIHSSDAARSRSMRASPCHGRYSRPRTTDTCAVPAGTSRLQGGAQWK